MKPKWKGSLDIQEDPRSPRYETTASGLRITRVYRGPFSSLLAAAPAPAQEMADFPNARVESVSIAPDAAGMSGPGTMTIVASDDSQNVTLEVDWTQLERDIRVAPYYSLLTTSTMANLARWEQEDDPDLRGNFQFKKPDGTIGTLNGIVAGLANKLLRGQQSYIVPAPVARRTTRSYTKPITTTMGKIENPPVEIGAPAGYVWLKTADRAIRQGRNGKWERIEEWTGADWWDTEIYPAA